MKSNLPVEPVIHILPDSNQVCFVIPKLFSKEECKALLNPEIKNSFQKTNFNYPTYYRNNDRFVVDNKQLANHLFEKVKPFLPQTIRINNINPVENGIWQLYELNNRIRYCRYKQGQYFNRHLDGVHFRSNEIQSKLTFMLYLNGEDEFTGGRTLFYKTKESAFVWAEYLPQQGDLIVFDHNIWHEGERLLSGEKFVLRSDILYQAVAEENQTQLSLDNYQEGHLGYIWKLLLFDDKTLLSAGRDKLIKVWNEKGECMQRLEGHQNSILCLAKLNPDCFLSGSRDRSIRVWQQEDNKFILKREIQIHQATVLSLCKINESTFASGGGDNVIHISSLIGQKLKTLTGHTDWVWNIIKLSDHLLASCSEDKSIRIWEYQEGECIAHWQEEYPIQSLAYHIKTNTLISANLNGEISIYKPVNNFRKWVREITFKGHIGIIRDLLLLDERYLASSGEDNKVRIWDLTNASLIAEFEHTNFVQSIVMTPKKQLISASYDGQIKLWDKSLPEFE